MAGSGMSEKDITESSMVEKDMTEKDIAEKDIAEKDMTEKDIAENGMPEKRKEGCNAAESRPTMRELIDSDYVYEYYREKGIFFTDEEKACILWNKPMDRQELLKKMEELAQTAEDEGLRRRIRDRLTYEAESEKCFYENGSGQYIYTVAFEGEDWVSGFFAKATTAREFGRNDGEHRHFTVEKQFVMEDGGVWADYEGQPAAAAEYDTDGRLLSLWIDKSLLGDAARDLADDRGEDCFCKAFFMESPFERGDVVRSCLSGRIGIVETLRERQNRRKDWSGQETCDYSDSSTTMVEFLTDQGFSHGHPCILDLEKLPDDRWENETEEIVCLGASVIKGKVGLDWFLDRYMKYMEKKV